jgi:hypothetical protein
MTGAPFTPTESALSLDGVRSAYFWASNGGYWTGVVYHAPTDIEYDVRQTGRFNWYASDDDGFIHYGETVTGALRSAFKANTND